MTENDLEISVAQVKAILDAGEPFQLVDCREQLEADFAGIEGALLVPVSELVKRLEELEPYKQSRIVFHCHLGMRSLRIIPWLRQQGFTEAVSMTGGIDSWSEEIDPAVPRYRFDFEGLSPLEAAEDDPV
jgi:rhodanese-related sulfurtransferase